MGQVTPWTRNDRSSPTTSSSMEQTLMRSGMASVVVVSVRGGRGAKVGRAVIDGGPRLEDRLAAVRFHQR